MREPWQRFTNCWQTSITMKQWWTTREI